MPDPYTLALGWLAARELSIAQVRTRLLKRKLDPQEIDEAIRRLTISGALDDTRVAQAAVRDETVLRLRGRRRVTRRLRELGIEGAVAQDAIAATFREIDEDELLDTAIRRQLQRRRTSDPADQKSLARLVRALTAQGFELHHILKRLRQLRTDKRFE